MRKGIKKFIIYFVSCLLVVVLPGAISFGLNYFIKSARNNKDIGKTSTKYRANADGTRIENIPFDYYIHTEEVHEGAVTPEISTTAPGEENSDSINAVIASLPQDGTVYIPSGEYKVSTIWLKSDMTLFISEGARLVSLDCDENENSAKPLEQAVIRADGASNICIRGGGTVVGSGTSYTLEPEVATPLYALEEFNLYTRVVESRKRIRFSKDTERNNIIRLNDCNNVSIRNIVLEESAEWTLVINESSNIEVKDVVIDNNFRVANSDGIDICGSSDVSILRCFIATGDDAIVIKSPTREVNNVHIEECELSSFANCFKIGTETVYPVRNVKVLVCSFFLPDGMTGGYAGIAIESADGADVSDITVVSILMNGISSPILIWLGNRLSYDKKTVGSISDITIMNINAVNTELPSAITGCKVNGTVYPVQNIKLENIVAYYRDTAENLSVRKTPSEASMDGYPEITRVSHIYFISHELSAYWDLPCYGIFIRHAQDVDHSDYYTVPRSCSTLPDVYK